MKEQSLWDKIKSKENCKPKNIATGLTDEETAILFDIPLKYK